MAISVGVKGKTGGINYLTDQIKSNNMNLENPACGTFEGGTATLIN